MPHKDPEQAKAYKAAYYQRNKEAIKARSLRRHYDNLDQSRLRRKAYYAAHADQAKEESSAYYAEHRNEILESQKQRRLNDPDLRAQTNARSVQWQKDNPELVALRELRRKARKLNAFVEDVYPLVVLEMDDGVCGICGEDVDPLDYQVDHVIPLSKGGEHGYHNTQVSHPRCNQSKGSKLPWLM